MAPVVRAVTAPARGYVARLGAIAVGNAALHLGAGRRTKEDTIDHAVGVVCHASAATGRGGRADRRGARARRGAAREAGARCRRVRARRRAGPPRPVLLEVVD